MWENNRVQLLYICDWCLIEHCFVQQQSCSTIPDLIWAHLLSYNQHLIHRGTTTTLQQACFDSTTYNTELTPLRDYTGLGQFGCTSCDGSVVKDLTPFLFSYTFSSVFIYTTFMCLYSV